MAKYGLEFKLKVVNDYLNGKGGYKTIADLHGIKSHTTVRKWVNNYRTLGIEGLEIKRKNNKYSFEFKKNIVELYLTGEMSYQDLANDLKISNPSMICRWVLDFENYGLEGLKPKKRGRSSKMSTNKDKKPKKQAIKKEYGKEAIDRIKELEEENYWLQMKVDILKKR